MRDGKMLGLIFGGLVIIALLGPLLGGLLMGGWGGAGMMGPGMMGGYWGPWSATEPRVDGWGWGLLMGFGMLSMLAFWGAILLGLVLLARWLLGQGGTASPGSQDPLAILQRRYARGEIDQPTYERMRHDLEQVPIGREGTK